MTTISVGKIEINIGKRTLSLTLDELKELRDVLNTTFSERPDYPIPDYYPIPIRPTPRVWLHDLSSGSAARAWLRSSDSTAIYDSQ